MKEIKKIAILFFTFMLATTSKFYGQAGINWTARISAADNNWFSVTYGNGLFVAVAQNGTQRVMTSPDGITWTARTSAASNAWRSVVYGNGLFVAVASSGTGNRVMTSPDGITWTARTSTADNNWFSVTYGNGLFVAVANSGSGNQVMTSPDGITWTGRSSPSADWFSVTYGNGLFVAVAGSASQQVMTSPDGITWTARTSAVPNQWYSVTYGNGLFVAVAYSGTGTGNRVMTSPDGITWTVRTSAADNQWNSVVYGNGLFVAVANSGTGNRVMTSPDGITWTARTSAADNLWYSVTYGNGMFVAVAYTGTGNRVMTSGSYGVLPLQWGDFKAQRQGNKALLTWTTLQEQNTADFEVQHSINTQQWLSVGTLLASGNSNIVRSYRFVHEGPFKASIQHYYRILQRDLDGKFSYSKVIRIEYPEASPDLVLYPNPANEVLRVNLTERQEVRLVNMQGVVVWKGVLTTGRHEIPVSNFATGNYILQTERGAYKVVIE